MDVFEVHERLVDDYAEFTSSLVTVRDPRIVEHLADEWSRRVRWPDPWLSLNPRFASGGLVEEAVADGLLHPECARIFRDKHDEDDTGARPITLHRHQREAVSAARDGASYVLTTGTGSGKSLTYLVPIVDSVLRDPEPGRIKAIVVYPMNALANSQHHELTRFLRWGFPRYAEPASFARYTGQEGEAERERILRTRPDILLTNYVMLEYLLTRPHERRLLLDAARGLRFLVLDELHTYRGRQGADVALLVRRLRDACAASDLQFVGTSATMATARTFAETQRTVADVATRLFGAPVTPDRVIGETVVRATAHPDPTPEALRSAVAEAPRLYEGERTYAELAADALAGWVESTFGVTVEEGGDRLVRRRPTRVRDAAKNLADQTGTSAELCERAIQDTLRAGARARDPDTGAPLFAFRLHQFLSKGDTVHVSIEPDAVRHITSQYQVSVPGAREKVLLPLAFCRECGQEYLVVSRVEQGGTVTYGPRHERDVAGGDAVNGYLYVSGDHPWPDDPVLAGRLPDSWVATADDGESYVVPRLEKYMPTNVWVGPDGTRRPEGEGLRAAYVPSPFRFCLRCRVSYEQTRGHDFAKLATFAAEGRSSAVSIVSASVVRSLRESDLDPSARKLLTFVDNRQDASLQAGHFNDFVQVTQLRGALYRAAEKAGGGGEEGLRHDDVAQRVAAALGLDLADFAQNPEARFGQRDAVQRAFRAAIALRVYLDLERGWRLTMPNLEQTGLIRFDYADLPDIAAAADCWADTHPALRDDEPEHRAELGRIVLDEMRRSLAIDVDVLSQDGFERLQKQSDQLLAGPWALPRNSPYPQVRTVFAAPARPGGPRSHVHFTGRSALGRYLRRPGEFPYAHGDLTVDDAHKVVSDLLRVLERYGLLTVAVDAKDGGAPGYRLKSSALVWRAGDGATGAPDPLRKTVDPEVGARVNEFFRDLYRGVAAELVGLYAAEHTAQVSAERRQEREDDFRAGTLPLLYCSPTMELGVDIATLNAVAMRNVPPTPANYAQRSGRAGRSGQPALVTTYCSTGSAHDQYYFRRSEQMVAGSVDPPRLDLTNEDLLRSHVHAVWLAETGASLGQRMTDVVDASGERPTLRIFPHLRAQLSDPDAGRRAVGRARAVLAELGGLAGLLHDSAWWYDGWVEDTVRAAPGAFDEACERWRLLYRNALADQEEQNRRVLDHATSPEARRQAQMRRLQAENQLRLLKNENEERVFSDFYSYRYFASEGFLPGYAFPRLPLAAYIPPQRGADGTYVQRPRFIAIDEFGPGALIYHEGQRYQVQRVQLPASDAGDVATADASICGGCGYWHDRRAGVDLCEHCGGRLGPITTGLMHLQTVFTIRRERISSDEEERRRAGFELQTSYRFSDHGARSGRLAAEVRDADGGPLADLVYGDTATVRRINRGRRRRQDPSDVGFWLDSVNGRWVSEKQAADLAPEDAELDDRDRATRALRVVPYVEDRRNVVVLRLAEPVRQHVAVTLRYALERGIETVFQLEDAELASEQLPDPEDRGRMLFVESAEGGAGVLRRLQAEPDALARVARAACEIIHVDPETGEDLGHALGARERCERGCYDCLLSYTNQTDHARIDRLAAVDLLLRLTGADVRGVGPGAAGAEAGSDARLARLFEACGSKLEREFLRFLDKHRHRLPDEAQTLVPAALARPDFVYRLAGGDVAVFVDGPHHDHDAVTECDVQATYRLEDQGWLVVRVRHDDAWDALVGKYPSVFGAGRER